MPQYCSFMQLNGLQREGERNVRSVCGEVFRVTDDRKKAFRFCLFKALLTPGFIEPRSRFLHVAPFLSNGLDSKYRRHGYG